MAQNAITIHIYNKTDGKHAVFVATWYPYRSILENILFLLVTWRLMIYMTDRRPIQALKGWFKIDLFIDSNNQELNFNNYT